MKKYVLPLLFAANQVFAAPLNAPTDLVTIDHSLSYGYEINSFIPVVGQVCEANSNVVSAEPKKVEDKTKKNKKKGKSKKGKSNKAKTKKKPNFLWEPFNKLEFSEEQKNKIEDLRSYKKLKSIVQEISSAGGSKEFKKSEKGKALSRQVKSFKKYVGFDLYRSVLTKEQSDSLQEEKVGTFTIDERTLEKKFNVRTVAGPSQSSIDQYSNEHLNAKGKELHGKYAKEYQGLKDRLKSQIPSIDESKKEAYIEAHHKVLRTEAIMLTKKEEAKKKIVAVNGRLMQTKGWVNKATLKVKTLREQIAAAKKEGNAKADLVTKLEEDLYWAEINVLNGTTAHKKAKEAVEKGKSMAPALKKELANAQNDFVKAKAQAKALIEGFNVTSYISSNKMDKDLIKYKVLQEAKPVVLAQFAQESPENEKLVTELLNNDELMKQMVLADGPSSNAKKRKSKSASLTGKKYGQAMKIYTDIQKASKKASSGLYQRLALATALVHAVPVHSNRGSKDKPQVINPVERYLHYEKAYDTWELDANFKDFTVWEYKMVVNGDELMEEAAWGRNMLHNYNPSILSAGAKWDYVKLVTSDVSYNSKDQKYDNPDLFKYQNILNNGGVCGRRAFMGRFILRCFGIPTKARPQSGHAALVRWTSKGWVPVLGGGWGSGFMSGYSSDKDFLAVTQAREDMNLFMEVLRAQWAGDINQEGRIGGLLGGTPNAWRAVALYRQDDIIKELKAITLEAAGAELGESDSTVVKGAKEVAVTVTDKDKEVIVSNDGTISIPSAAATSEGKLNLMKSKRGGLQLHLQRNGKEVINITLDVPKAGTYDLNADVVTVHWKQKLQVKVNNSETPVEMSLPYTLGEWQKSAPVKIQLTEGKNVITFSRTGDNIKGITIKDFILKPASHVLGAIKGDIE